MLRKFVPCLLLLASVQCHAAPVPDSGIEFLNVAADHASEDPDRDTLLLRGHLRMETHDWVLEAERAAVHGPANRPDRVRLEGSPVRLRSIDNGGDEDLEASAPVIEYDRATNTLLLSGGSLLRQGRQVLRSDTIEYDIESSRFQARGAEGVTIEAPPEG